MNSRIDSAGLRPSAADSAQPLSSSTLALASRRFYSPGRKRSQPGISEVFLSSLEKPSGSQAP